MIEGQHIAYRWKDKNAMPFSDGWIKAINGRLVRLSDYKYGEGSWYLIDEIEWYVLKE